MLEQPIGSQLKKLTLPMIYGMVLLMTFGLVDTFFVSLLGTDELAAISFTFPVTFTVISLNIGLGIGTSAVIGKLLGAQRQSEAQLTAVAALLSVFVMVGCLCALGYVSISPIFTLLGAEPKLLPLVRDYMSIWYLAGVFLAIPMVGNSVLRAAGDTKTPSMIMAAGGAINALLDPLLIFGWGPVPAFGIKGAAIATAIAWATGVVWILVLLLKRNLMVARWLSWHEYQVHAKEVLRIGIPAAGANMLTPVATGIVTAIIATFGATAVAAWGVGGRLESIASIVMLALSMSLPPMLSQNLGAGRIDRVAEAYRVALKFVLGFQLLVFVVLFVTAPWIALAFAREPDVTALITLFLMVVPLGYGVQGVIVLTNSALNAIHQPMKALALNALRLFMFFVPFAYIGSIYYQLSGVFWGIVIANASMAVISYRVFQQAIQQLPTAES
jgi:putative MATE family efflux protein